MQIEAEFRRIVSKNLQQSFFDGLDELVPRFLRIYRQRQTVKDLPAFLNSLDEDVSNQFLAEVLLTAGLSRLSLFIQQTCVVIKSRLFSISAFLNYQYRLIGCQAYYNLVRPVNIHEKQTEAFKRENVCNKCIVFWIVSRVCITTMLLIVAAHSQMLSFHKY